MQLGDIFFRILFKLYCLLALVVNFHGCFNVAIRGAEKLAQDFDGLDQSLKIAIRQHHQQSFHEIASEFKIDGSYIDILEGTGIEFGPLQSINEQDVQSIDSK